MGWPGYSPDILSANELERANGIEPSSVAWEATALPLSYARILLLCVPRYSKEPPPVPGAELLDRDANVSRI